MPETERLLNNKHLFLTFLEAQKSMIMEMADLVSGESPPSQSQMGPSSCKVTWGKGKVSFLGSLSQALIPMKRSEPPRSNHFPKAPLPNISFWGDTDTQTIAHRYQSQFCHLLALCPGASHCTSLCFRGLSYKMGILIPTLPGWHDNLRFFTASLILKKGFESGYGNGLCKFP